MGEKTKIWLRDVAIRTVKTMAQSALGVIGTATVIGGVDWRLVAGTVALSAVTCVLMNVAVIGE